MLIVLGKKNSNFVPPARKLHNPYCHTDQEADANSRFSEDQRPRPPFEGRVECVVDYVHTVSFHELF